MANRGRAAQFRADDPQAIINNYVLRPGDRILIDSGDYVLDHDVLMTEADSGTPQLPIRIQGPTGGGRAVLTRIPSANIHNGVLVLADFNSSDSTPMQGVVVENIETSGGNVGIWLSEVSYCEVRNCECHHHGETGTEGGYAEGTGILVGASSHCIVEGNLCHHNGGLGGAGTAAMPDGGGGAGFGISLRSTEHSIVRANECFANGGTGGDSGAESGVAGVSQAFGISVAQSISGEPPRSNVIVGNLCYENECVGVNGAPGLGGGSGVFGIDVRSSEGSRVFSNTVFGNRATGGDSATGSGANVTCAGIFFHSNTELEVSRNLVHNNVGVGGAGNSTNEAAANGSADVTGIWLQSSAGAIVSNNLAYDNNAISIGTRGVEMTGSPNAGGLWIIGSEEAKILNNTFYRNRPSLDGGGDLHNTSGQILVYATSIGCVIKNNICGSFDPVCPAIYLDSSSQPETVSDYNALYSEGGNVGGLGSTAYADMAEWQDGTGLDANSVSVNPGFYDLSQKEFHLRADSPLIDAGELLAEVTEDGDGESRPAPGPNATGGPRFDIGYDEYVDSDTDGLADVIETTVTLTRPDADDSDGDGLPDGWELAFGLQPDDPDGLHGSGGDPDNDGFTNLEEYLGDSRPDSATSVPVQLPVITSASPQELDLFIVEGDGIEFSAAASDPDGEPVSYSWSVDDVVRSDASFYTFTTTDESSGLTTLSATYIVKLVVSAGGDEVYRTWIVTVANRNRAPVLQPLENLRVRPGDVVQLDPVFSDPDNENLASGDDNALTVTYSGFMTGPVRAVSTSDVGSHTVTVAVHDNGSPNLSVQRSFRIDVVNASLVMAPSGGQNRVVEGDPAGDSYTVALGVPPRSDVSIDVSASSGLIVSPENLTFTPDDWSTPQLVTLRAPDNAIAEDDRAEQVFHSVTSSDPAFHLLPVFPLEVTIVDDDQGGVTIAPSGGSTAVAEGGAGDSYGVVLLSAPSDPVTITVRAGPRLVPSPSVLTFTSANWSIQQNVHLTAVDDEIAHGDALEIVKHEVSSADPNYGGFAVPDVPVQLSDDERQAVVLSDESLAVPEGGQSAFTVRLAERPPENVTVTIEHDSGDIDLSVASAGSLSFSPTDWDTPKIVSITSVEDDDALSGSALFLMSSPGLAARTVTAVEIENDVQELKVSPLTLEVNEGGSSILSICLSARPETEIEVTIARSSGDEDVSLVGAGILTFNSENWNLPIAVAIGAAQDSDSADGSAVFLIQSPGLPAKTVTATEIDDDDSPRLLVSADSLELAEGGSGTFAVSLTARPTANLTVTVSRFDGDEDLSIAGATVLTFTPQNWSAPQTVGIVASEDDDAIDDRATFIVSAPDGASQTIAVTAMDNDRQSLLVSSAGIVVNEGGHVAVYVWLASQPDAIVTATVTRTAGDADLAVSDGENMVFDFSNWNSPQQVTISAAHDSDALDGDAAFTIASVELNSMSTLIVSEKDDDQQGLIVSDEKLVVEEGGTAFFTVRLASQPAGEVIVDTQRIEGDPDLGISSGGRLVFNQSNWMTPIPVAVVAAEDPDRADGTATFSVSGVDLPTANIAAVESDNDAIVRFVRSGVANGGDGNSWANAYANLETALDSAPEGAEIWVAAGTYTPPVVDPVGATFWISKDLSLYGGFAGNEVARSQRNWDLHETHLSGNMGLPGVSEDNSELLVYVSSACRIDGFSISGAFADGDLSPVGFGGAGVFINSDDVVVANCRIEDNFSRFGGAGLFTIGDGIRITNCQFSRNAVVADDYAYGGFYGGIFGFGASGGALLILGDDAFVERCTFTENSVVADSGPAIGGAVVAESGTFDQCVFSKNSARARFGIAAGGGIFGLGDALVITNCTFHANRVDGIYGGAMGGGVFLENGWIGNSILTANTANGDSNEAAQVFSDEEVSVNYSCVEGLSSQLDGLGNIDVNPHFADPEAGDYHLRSIFGRWTGSSWVIDILSSPCIDAGDPESPFDRELSPNGGRINMGAFGNTEEASLSNGPRISIDDIVVFEGNSGSSLAEFTLTLSAPIGSPVTVAYSTANVTADTNDYVPAAGVLVFPAGVISRSLVVTVMGDTLFEMDETFELGLSSPVGATLASPAGTAIIVDGDADGDRMPDDFEWTYGLNSQLSADALWDSDNDGFNNYEEYLSGTDPSDGSSFLRLESVVRRRSADGGGAIISWRSVAGTLYRLERSYDLEHWQVLADDLLGVPPLNKLVDDGSPPLGRVFYRLKVYARND